MAKPQFDDPAKVRLKMVRLSYPHLFRPKGFGKKNEGDPKFSATAIIDPDTKAGASALELLDDAIAYVREEKWGKKQPKIKGDRICLREGDSDEDETNGMMICTTSNLKRPLTLDENGDEVVEADDVIYGGCYVDMIIRVWAQDNDYGQRVNASLEGVKFRKDGEAFSAAFKTSADDFDDDDDDDEAPKRGRSRSRSRDDDDDDEAPKRGRSRSRDADDEDEAPKRGRSRSRDADDEDEAPKRGRSRSRDADDDDEDEAPKRGRSRSRDADDDDEDEAPKRGRSRSRDADDEDEAPKRRTRSAGVEKPKSQRGRKDDYDY